jgi:hypothetical protein
MTRSLAREWGGDGITVNAVAPGLTLVEATEYVPMARHQKYQEGRAIPREQQAADVMRRRCCPACPASALRDRPGAGRQRRLRDALTSEFFRRRSKPMSDLSEQQKINLPPADPDPGADPRGRASLRRVDEHPHRALRPPASTTGTR